MRTALAIAWLGLVACGAASAPPSASSPPSPAASSAPSAPSPARPAIDVHVPVAPTPISIEGERQLIYELHVAGAGPLTRVQVRDERGAILADLRGDDLARRVGSGAVYLELSTAAGPIPAALDHRVEYDLAGTPAVADPVRVAVPSVPPLHLGPPLRGGPWVAIHDPSWPRGHRRVFYTVDGRTRIPGRYAIDWMKVDAAGRTSRGDDDQVRSWFGYGADVIAVADGVIAATRDDFRESATVSAHAAPSAEEASGNYVALDLGGGRYAFYEHLKPGSVRVRPGDRIRRGQVLAALGFTGQSTGPHLHFHVAAANSPLGAEGVPYVFERFDLLGRYLEIDDLGRAPWKPLAAALRRAERPAPGAVVQFAP